MILIGIYIFSIFFSLLIGIFFFKKIETPFRVLTVMLAITLIAEMLAIYLAMNSQISQPVYHFYVVVSFWLYSLTYFLLMKNWRIRVLLLLAPVLFTGFSLLNSLRYQKLNEFPSISVTVNSCLLIVFSLLYYKYIIDRDPFEQFGTKAYFWFNTAVLVYFSIQIFIWGIFSYLIAKQMDLYPLTTFGIIVSIVYYGILGYAVRLNSKNKKM